MKIKRLLLSIHLQVKTLYFVSGQYILADPNFPTADLVEWKVGFSRGYPQRGIIGFRVPSIKELSDPEIFRKRYPYVRLYARNFWTGQKQIDGNRESEVSCIAARNPETWTLARDRTIAFPGEFGTWKVTRCRLPGTCAWRDCEIWGKISTSPMWRVHSVQTPLRKFLLTKKYQWEFSLLRSCSAENFK